MQESVIICASPCGELRCRIVAIQHYKSFGRKESLLNWHPQRVGEFGYLTEAWDSLQPSGFDHRLEVSAERSFRLLRRTRPRYYYLQDLLAHVAFSAKHRFEPCEPGPYFPDHAQIGLFLTILPKTEKDVYRLTGVIETQGMERNWKSQSTWAGATCPITRAHGSTRTLPGRTLARERKRP